MRRAAFLMAHALSLAVPVRADGQAMRSDYQELTSLGFVAGWFRADAGTPGVLGGRSVWSAASRVCMRSACMSKDDGYSTVEP